MFRLEKFPNSENFPTKRIIPLSNRTCKFSSRTGKFSSRTCKLYFSPWIHYINIEHAHSRYSLPKRDSIHRRRVKSVIRPLLYPQATTAGLSVLLFLALIASLLHWESKQAINNKTDTKQSIKFKEGEINCYKERNITACPNAWHNIPFG